MNATSRLRVKFGLPIIPVIDRVDGLAKSLVFPGSVRAGFAGALTTPASTSPRGRWATSVKACSSRCTGTRRSIATSR